jgi:hypothetical protein
MAQAGLYPRFRADDRDGNPLSGGKIYAFASGTSTPLAVYDDVELTTALVQPIVLDASGEAEFYYSGASYRLVLTDKDDVPQWEIDPVTGGFGGSTGVAGLGIGSNTVLLRPGAGTAQASGTVFPPDVLALGLTVTVSETLGSAQGLAQVGIGYDEQPDAWGVLETLTATRDSTAGWWLAYGSVPQPTSGVVTLTAYGGLFDGSGAVYVTGHFFHFSPSETVGYRYLPGTPEAGQILPPIPPATETERGAIELATPAEVSTGTDPERAVTPATLATRLNTRVPAGTALSVARYATGGVNLEASPLSVDASSNLRLGTVTAGASAQRAIVLASGVFPTTFPADAVQMAVGDREGVALQAALHIWGEGGTLTTIGAGGLMAKRVARALTTNGAASPYALTLAMSGSQLIANNGTEITYITLPVATTAAAWGVYYWVGNYQASPRGCRVVAPSPARIQLGTAVSAAGGYIQTTAVGDWLHIVCINNSSWHVQSPALGWVIT